MTANTILANSVNSMLAGCFGSFGFRQLFAVITFLIMPASLVFIYV